MKVFGGIDSLTKHKDSLILGFTNLPLASFKASAFSVLQTLKKRKDNFSKTLLNKVFFFDPLDRVTEYQYIMKTIHILGLIRAMSAIANCDDSFLFQTVLTKVDETVVAELIQQTINNFTKNIELGSYEKAGEDWKILRCLGVIQDPNENISMNEIAEDKLLGVVESSVFFLCT